MTTPANVHDGKVLTEVITEHQASTGIKVKTTVADKAYGTGENYKYLCKQGITPCISHQHQNCNRDPAFNKNKFSYNKEQDCYICPVGNRLRRSQFKRDKNATVYKATFHIKLLPQNLFEQHTLNRQAKIFLIFSRVFLQKIVIVDNI
ncbi:MAG: transposase [Sedimentisphaerales bacterium]|nr:transposase [Sedimentisphaerales bacterium]